MKRFARDLIIGYSISSMVANPNYAAGLKKKSQIGPQLSKNQMEISMAF
jgi:hypothetical protein